MIDFNLLPLLPEIFIALTAMGLLIVGVERGNDSTAVLSWYSVCVYFIAFIMILGQSWGGMTTALNEMFIFDSFAGFAKAMILIGLMVSVALSTKYIKDTGIERFEYPVLVMLAGLGMMLMVSANNMLSLYMGLELQSLSLYVLASFNRSSLRSAEAGIKYFILGAISSGMLLFGISMIYGFVGSLDFATISSTISGLDVISPGVVVGLVFMLAGLAFKISAVPFHMWTPDVYQGAPSSVTALFAIVPKIAAMALLMRLLFDPFGAAFEQWGQILYAVSLGSMILGAFAGIAQDNLKRLLAYSSIGNMGYALIGLAVGTEQGAAAVVLYMFIYMLMTAGTFAVVLAMRRDDQNFEKISDLSGLSVNHPALAYCMAILMFSMSGIPPLAGFFGKFMIFQAAVEAQYYVLAVLGVLTSVVAAYYYLKIIKVMFFDEPKDPFDDVLPLGRFLVLLVSVGFVVLYIFSPSSLIEGAEMAVEGLLKQ